MKLDMARHTLQKYSVSVGSRRDLLSKILFSDCSCFCI